MKYYLLIIAILLLSITNYSQVAGTDVVTDSSESILYGNTLKMITLSYSSGKKTYGVRDKNNKVILPNVYDNIYKSEPFYISDSAKRFNIYDLNFNLILGSTSEYIHFEKLKKINCFISVDTTRRFSLFDEKGNEIFIDSSAYQINDVIPSEYENIRSSFVLVSNKKGQKLLYNVTLRKAVSNWGYFWVGTTKNTFLVSNENKYNETKDYEIRDLNFKPISGNIYKKIISTPGDNIYIVQKENKYGVINGDDQLIINFDYDLLTTIYLESKKHFIAKKNNKFGIIDLSGSIIKEFAFDSIFQRDAFIFYRSKKNYTAGKTAMYLNELSFDSLIHSDMFCLFLAKKGKMIVYRTPGFIEEELLIPGFKAYYDNYGFGIYTLKNASALMGSVDFRFAILVPFTNKKVICVNPQKKTFFIFGDSSMGFYRNAQFYPSKINFDIITPFEGNYLVVKGKKQGLVHGKSLELVIPCKYDLITFDWKKNKMICKSGSKFETIDIN